MKQDQFLTVIDRDEAERRFHAVLDLRPLPAQEVFLSAALGRVLAHDVTAPIDVPGYDRSNVDGLAVRAEDTFGASEDQPRRLRLTDEALWPGVVPARAVGRGQATSIATGAVAPRGADAVVMVEDCDVGAEGEVVVRRPVTPGANLTCAGTDIGRGETVLRRGELLTSRETGVLAALGIANVPVVRQPRVAIISTGNELVEPGRPLRPGLIFDSNATVLADAVRECGGEAIPLGIVADDRQALRDVLHEALCWDVVLLSGGTSKGEGDLCYRVVAELGPPGIVAHGVALKPGKPLCLAAVHTEEAGEVRRTVPIVILPGFPTSAIFTFHEFVAPVIRSLAGRQRAAATVLKARLPLRVNSERGRTEYLLVALVPAVDPARDPFIAYPMGKGSGSVTTFSRADGFVVIPRQQEYVEANSVVDVHLLSADLKPADLVVIGSHCVGVDYLLGRLHDLGFRTKFLAVGSSAGLEAARRGECDLAGIHLFDPKSERYNLPFVTDELTLVEGYQRLQGIVYRQGDPRFEGRAPCEAVARALADASCILVNRNRGSGTRMLVDRLLQGAAPSGHSTEAHSHNAVVAAVAQGRADWGVAIATVACDAGLGFIPLQEEHFDFAVPNSRCHRLALEAFVRLLNAEDVRRHLRCKGFTFKPNSPRRP